MDAHGSGLSLLASNQVPGHVIHDEGMTTPHGRGWAAVSAPLDGPPRPSLTVRNQEGMTRAALRTRVVEGRCDRFTVDPGSCLECDTRVEESQEGFLVGSLQSLQRRFLLMSPTWLWACMSMLGWVLALVFIKSHPFNSPDRES
jgi:hypothetical protein